MLNGKSIFAGLLVSVALLNAQTIDVTNNWKLVGAKCDIDVKSELNSTLVKQVYLYDNFNGKASWKVFNNITDLNGDIGDLVTIKAGQGFWILGSEDGTVKIDKSDVNELLSISNGWNLLGAIGDIKLSSIFNTDDKIGAVWKYDNKSGWLFSKKDNQTFDDIKAGEGFWLYSGTEDINIQNLKDIENNFIPKGMSLVTTEPLIDMDFETELVIDAKNEARGVGVSLVFVEKKDGDDKVELQSILDDKNRLKYSVQTNKIDIEAGEHKYNLKAKIPSNVSALTDYIVYAIIDPSESYKESNENDNNNFDIVKTDSNLVVAFDYNYDKAIITNALNISDYILEKSHNSILITDENYTFSEYLIGGTFSVEIKDREKLTDTYLSACLEIGDECHKIDIWDSTQNSFQKNYLVKIPERAELKDNEIYEESKHYLYAEFVVSEDILAKLKESVIKSENVINGYKHLDSKLRITLSEDEVVEYTDTNSITKDITLYYNDTLQTRGIISTIANFNKNYDKSVINDWVGSTTNVMIDNFNNQKESYQSIQIGLKATKIANWEGGVLSNHSYSKLDKTTKAIKNETTTQLTGYTVHHLDGTSSTMELQKVLFKKTFVDREFQFMVSIVPVGVGIASEGSVSMGLKSTIIPTAQVEFMATPEIDSSVSARAYIGREINIGVGKLQASAGISGSLEPFVNYKTPSSFTNIFDSSKAGSGYTYYKSSIKLDQEIETVKGSISAYVSGGVCAKWLGCADWSASAGITSWSGYSSNSNLFNKVLGEGDIKN